MVQRARKRGPGNPTTSEWYSTPAAMRNRKPFGVTLSDEERSAAEDVAEAHGVPLSRVVGAALIEFYNLSKTRQAAAIADSSEND
jgi:hypothetical protein